MTEKSILIVDDENINHFLCDKIIESIHWINKTYRSYNGRQALDLIRDHCTRLISVPDIILLDLNMPLMSGLEFLREFKALECLGARLEDVVIAVVSSSIDPKEHSQIVALGVRHLIDKPISREKLDNVLCKEFEK